MTTAFETFEDTPPRLAVGLVLLPAVVAVVATFGAPLAMITATTGTVLLIAGVRFGSRRVITAGAVVQFGAVLVAGAMGLWIPQVTVAAAASVIAWDAGENAIGIAGQVGARGRPGSVLVAHTAATTLVAVAVGLAALAVYWFTRGGEPATAIALLAFAAVLFTLLLDR